MSTNTNADDLMPENTSKDTKRFGICLLTAAAFFAFVSFVIFTEIENQNDWATTTSIIPFAAFVVGFALAVAGDKGWL